MTRALPSTLAVGFDAVLAVDPEVYTPVEDVRGRAYAFQMDDETRDHVAEAVRDALDRPGDMEDLAVEPGYVRVRVRPSDHRHAHPRDLLDAVTDAADLYNQRHAETDAERLAFQRDGFVGSYRPDTDADREAYLSARVSGDVAPESDGEPVWSYTRPQAGETALSPERRCAYRFVLPFDTSMYTYADETGDPRHNVTWEPTEVREHLEGVVEDLVPWPDDPREGTPLVAVYPTHAVVEHYTDALANPAARAGLCRRALLKYNRPRPDDDARAPRGTTVKHPPLAMQEHAFVEALDHGGSADAWIAEHDLDTVEGEPVVPDPEPDATDDADGDDADTGGVLSRFTG